MAWMKDLEHFDQPGDKDWFIKGQFRKRELLSVQIARLVDMPPRGNESALMG
jgi:hypothetical protein